MQLFMNLMLKVQTLESLIGLQVFFLSLVNKVNMGHEMENVDGWHLSKPFHFSVKWMTKNLVIKYNYSSMSNFSFVMYFYLPL